MLESNIQSISSKHSTNSTKSQSIGKGNSILHSPSSGITRINMYTYQCQDILINPSKTSNTIYPFASRIALINGEYLSTATEYNMHQIVTPPLNLTRMKKSSENCWSTVVLFLGCRLKHDHVTQHHSRTKIQTYRTHS